MPLSSLSISSADASELEADVLVLGVASTKDGPVLVGVGSLDAFSSVSRSLTALGLSGAVDSFTRLPAPDGVAASSVALVGLGSGTPSIDVLRSAAGQAVRLLAGVESVAIAIPTAGDDELEAVLEGAALGSYAFTTFRTVSAAAVKAPVKDVLVATARGEAEAMIGRALVIADAVARVKDLVNTPPSHLYPETLAQAVADGVGELPIDIDVWDEERLASDGFGGILGVGSGSVRPPRLVKVSYSPAGAARHLAIVGKGITFDTGGLSLKPPVSMVGMKYDMTGAAVAYAVVRAAAELELPVRLTAWLCIAENMPSGSATRPNDVLTIRGGRTVENLNSDAEGRLVMADGLVAASEEHPDAIIDVATLTGAVIVALGTRTVAVMGADDLVADVLDEAARAGEPMWRMPFPTELRGLLDSSVADIANVKPGNTAGGMLVAGVFLREFVGPVSDETDAPRIPWAHLDIAGSANNVGTPYGFTGAGPTGSSVRTLLGLAERFSRA